MSAYGTPSLPLGVAVIAVLLGLFGALVLVGGLVVILAVTLGTATMGWATTFGVGLIAGLIAFVIGAIVLAIAFGLWDQELWAFVLALIVTGLAVFWFIGRPLYDGGGLASIENLPALVSGVLFVYLLAVEDHFW
jgi:hypothetical protein